MARFYGKIGYAITEMTEPGIYEERLVEEYYFGDIVKNTRRLRETSNINDDINISNQISILADPYLMNNFHSMRYVIYMGTKWKVSEVEVQYPRLILTLGGIYNG